MLSDKRLQAETWDPSGLQENVFANPRSTLESLQIPYKGTHQFMTSTAAGQAPAPISTGRLVAREEDRKGSTIPVPTFARRPTTMNSFVPVDSPQSSMVGQQRQQISGLQFDKFPPPSSFLCRKIRFRSQVTACSDSPSEAMLRIKAVEMADSMEELKSSRSVAGKNFPNFVMLDAKITSALNKIIQNSHFSEKVSLEEQKAPEGGPVGCTSRIHNKIRGKRVCGRFRSKHAHGQQKKYLNDAELETVRVSKNPTVVIISASKKRRRCTSMNWTYSWQ